MFQITYAPDIPQDLQKLSADIQSNIRRAIESKLMESPHIFGTRLRRDLKGYWKLRVGDYRIIYKILRNSVLVLKIGHRREIYSRWKET